MNWKEMLEPEDYFIGACLQFPLYFIIGFWVIPLMLVCGILWRLGGASGGSKLWRRIGVPSLVCLSTFLVLHHWTIFLAVPFMIWVSPFSYGKDGWLWKALKDDFVVRGICLLWFWGAFTIAYLIHSPHLQQ